MAEEKAQKYCGFLQGTNRELKCTDSMECNTCRLAPLFQACYDKGYAEGNADFENSKKNLQSTISNLERLQESFTVHDMFNRAVAIKNADVVKCKDIRRGTLITLKKGSVKCLEPLDIVQSMIKGTYNCY